ncbi:endo alpha-1,4 polygalactosaminidase [Microbacterium sp. HJ5]
MSIGRGAASVIVAVFAAVSLAACAGGASSVTLPPEGAAPDYQLGEGYPPPDDVGIVVRDRTAPPPEGIYSICYINAFQTQPDELSDWPDELVLKGEDGEPVYDPDWPDEALLDTSTDDSREAIEDIVSPWIQECAQAGFRGIEFDNLDSHTRSDGALTLENNLELAEELVEIAHEAGLAAAQKNAAEDAATFKADAGFDFAIAEQCAEFDECAAYEEVYDDHVIAIEYSDPAAFQEACKSDGMPDSAVLRDRDLSGPDDPGYVFELCSDDD